MNDVTSPYRAAPPPRSLPTLDRIRIATPCDAAWSEMEGDDKICFCGECRKNVYDLSAMTRYEAETFLDGLDELPCVRLYRRADGTVLTAECPVGVAKVDDTAQSKAVYK